MTSPDPRFSLRTHLLEKLAIDAYEYRPDAPFQLVSGALSDDYLDCKRALANPDTLGALGQVFAEALLPAVAAIGGLTMGADPIAISASLASLVALQPKRWFSVRKEPKGHGQRRLIEGTVLRARTPVAVVDDVVTSGESTIKAIRACREAALEIVQVIVLVDRQEQEGMANVRREAGGVPVSAVFTKAEIRAAWLRLQHA